MVTIDKCPVCGESIRSGVKGDRGIITCSSHGDIYVDTDP